MTWGRPLDIWSGIRIPWGTRVFRSSNCKGGTERGREEREGGRVREEREGGREMEREGGRVKGGGREKERQGGKKGGREGGREKGKEGRR